MTNNITVSVAEAAKMLGVSRPVMYRLTRRADFPAFYVGGRLLVDVDGLKKWVRRQSMREGNV